MLVGSDMKTLESQLFLMGFENGETFLEKKIDGS